MTKRQWQAFEAFRENFRKKCTEWNAKALSLGFPQAQKALAIKDAVPEYPIENSVVYNTKLDTVTKQSDIKLILVSDNPGKDEQREKNKAYLVGQAGKLAEGFFRKNPELGIHFSENLLILNKSPVHTAKTKELALLVALLKPEVQEEAKKLLSESQKWMAGATLDLQSALVCPLWIVGYGELKKKGIFEDYFSKIVSSKNDAIYLFQHFSMNRFSIDLKANWSVELSLEKNLAQLGKKHFNRLVVNFLS